MSALHCFHVQDLFSMVIDRSLNDAEQVLDLLNINGLEHCHIFRFHSVQDGWLLSLRMTYGEGTDGGGTGICRGGMGERSLLAKV